MGPDYVHMSVVLRALAERYPRNVFGPEIGDRTGLPAEDLEAAIAQLQSRGWVMVHPRGTHVRLVGQGVDFASCDGAQLLAIDVVSWIKTTGSSSFRPEDLPAALRADRDMLTLALEELDRADAIKAHTARGRIDHCVVKPAFRLYATGRGAPMSIQHYQQVEVHGDVVGGDKNTNTGSGAIVTGDGNAVSTNEDVAESLTELVAGLRSRKPVLNPAALDALASAAADGLSQVDVAARVQSALRSEPRLGDQLLAWMNNVSASVAGSAIYAGVKFALAGI